MDPSSILNISQSHPFPPRKTDPLLLRIINVADSLYYDECKAFSGGTYYLEDIIYVTEKRNELTRSIDNITIHI